MKHIERLNWDSDFFKMRIGRVLLDNEVKFDPIGFKKEADENYDLIYIFSYQKMINQNKLILANLELVDIMVKMSKPFEKSIYARNLYEFRTNLSDEELIDCYAIAENTCTVSRFFNEEGIGPKNTKLLYRKWIDNAVKGPSSDGIFLIKEKNAVVGLHLIKLDKKNNKGVFTLTGVNPDYKRLGLGRKLWEQSFGFFSNESDINIIQSPFSFRNTASFNFHIKMGFNKIEEIKYIYHFRKSK
jgi:ribosomal protein S18 acetylase RimI-like enzyme